MKQDTSLKPKWTGTLSSYIQGFIFSILLTLAAYGLVVEQLLKGWSLVFTIIGLGVVQMFVQLLFFLHLGKEAKPHWNRTVLTFMLLIVLILVLGSLWIMYNLNGRVMTM